MLRHFKFSVLCIVAGFSVLPACAVNAVTGRLQLVAMTEREEVELGNKIYSELRRYPGLIEDGSVAEYVSDLGGEIAVIMQGPAYRYRFSVVDSPEPNAFGLPGGHVMLTRGLLALCNDESELVGVLGHEIGHVVARHSSARAAATMPLDLLAAAVATAVGVFDAEQSQRVRDRLPQVLGAPYGREQEREADRAGVLLAASLGYDPAGLGRILGRMVAMPGGNRGLSAIVTGVKKESGIATHPPTGERMAIVDILAQTLEQGPPQDFARDHDEFITLFDGMSLGPEPNHTVVVGQTLIFPRQRFALDVPKDWMSQVVAGGYVAVAPGGLAVLSLESEPQPVGDEQNLFGGGGVSVALPMLTPGGVTVHHERWRDAAGVGMTTAYWFDIEGRRYRLVGTWQADVDDRFREIVDKVAVSIRWATMDELEPLGALRLRVVEAVDGDTVEALGKRTESAWSAVEIATANGLSPKQPLNRGVLVKIAVCESIGDRDSGPKHSCSH